MSVAVLVPVQAEEPWRQAAWEYTQRVLSEHGWPIILGSSPTERWCKGAALASARANTDAEILVVHDADLIVPAKQLHETLAAVASGVPWAMPYLWVRRLTHTATRALYEGTLRGRPSLERHHRGVVAGGCVVIRAEVWDDVGGIDPRFVGWGGEDLAFGYALRTLHGRQPMQRGSCTHLWHPHAAGRARHQAVDRESNALHRRYLLAQNDPEAMRALIAER